MIQRWRRWWMLAWCVMLVLSVGGVSRPPAAMARTPAGLAAADWDAIRAQLPHAPTAGIPAQQAYLKASNTEAVDLFGDSVAIDGNTVVVGAMFEDSSTTGINSNPNNNATDSGAVYVFVRSGTTWTQQAYIKASNPDVDDQFGQSVAVSGDTIVVGVRYEDSNATGVNGNQSNNSASASGAAYVFVRSGTTWSQQAYLKASNTSASYFFGNSVAIDNNTIVVGSPFEDTTVGGAGTAYVFTRTGNVWSQHARLSLSNPSAGDTFGRSVGISGNLVVVGADGEDGSATGVNGTSDELALNSGAAYVFGRSGQTWIQQAYLKASNTEAGDFFGGSVAIDGNTVVVGALAEDSNATNVDGDGSNNAAATSGAAYVFVRRNILWTSQAYLKASNTGAEDRFGRDVAISGTTIVVGAFNEDGSGTGVNPTDNNNATHAGAAYTYVFNGVDWVSQAYLKSANMEALDHFGSDVAISSDTVLVGAEQESSSGTGVNSRPDNNAGAAGAAYVFNNLGPTAVNWAGSSLNVDHTSAAAGDTLHYTLTVTDPEGGPYSVSSTFPDSVNIVSAPNMLINGNTITANNTLLAGISQTYHITVQVNAGSSGTISTTASLTDGVHSRDLVAPDVAVLSNMYLPLVTR